MRSACQRRSCEDTLTARVEGNGSQCGCSIRHYHGPSWGSPGTCDCCGEVNALTEARRVDRTGDRHGCSYGIYGLSDWRGGHSIEVAIPTIVDGDRMIANNKGRYRHRGLAAAIQSACADRLCSVKERNRSGRGRVRASDCCGEGNGHTIVAWGQGTRHNSGYRALAYGERTVQCARVAQVVSVTRVDTGDGMIAAKQCRRGVCCNATLTSCRCAIRHNIDACRSRLLELCSVD